MRTKNDLDLYDEIHEHLVECYTCLEHGFGLCDASQGFISSTPLLGIASFDFDKSFMGFALSVAAHQVGLNPQKIDEYVATHIVNRYHKYQAQNQKFAGRALRKLKFNAFMTGFKCGLTFQKLPASNDDELNELLALSRVHVMIHAIYDELTEYSQKIIAHDL